MWKCSLIGKHFLTDSDWRMMACISQMGVTSDFPCRATRFYPARCCPDDVLFAGKRLRNCHRTSGLLNSAVGMCGTSTPTCQCQFQVISLRSTVTPSDHINDAPPIFAINYNRFQFPVATICSMVGYRSDEIVVLGSVQRSVSI